MLAALALVACGPTAEGSEAPASTAGGEVASNQNAPAPEPYVASAAATVTPTPAPAAGLGTSPEAPVMACGPADSYRRVAEYRCPDGTEPLRGDPAAGGRARVGNVGANSRGHVIDLYRVPCASGVVELYVDMYGCPDMQGLLGGG